MVLLQYVWKVAHYHWRRKKTDVCRVW